MGYSCATGDLCGHGRDDLILGAPFDDQAGGNNSGSVILITGGGSEQPVWQLLKEILNPEPEESAHFGASVAAGDVDHDGNVDVIVGAPGRPLSQIDLDAGSVYVFFGPDFTAWSRFDGTPGERLGTAVAILGDLEIEGKGADGEEIIAGAPFAGANQEGRVCAIRWDTTLGQLVLVWSTGGLGANDNMGASLDGGGILNSSGHPRDALAGAPGSTIGSGGIGAVYALRGTNGVILGGAPLTPRPDPADCSFGASEFGASVRFTPDVGDDTDAKDELLVGSPGSDQVFYYMTGVTPKRPDTCVTGSGGSRFGAALTLVDHLPTVNGGMLCNLVDDRMEFAVGAPEFNFGQGRAHVISLDGAGGFRDLVQFVGGQAGLPGCRLGAQLGFALCRGDLVGPGSSSFDLVVGSPFDDIRDIADSGSARVYDGTELNECGSPVPVGGVLGGSYAQPVGGLPDFGAALAFRRYSVAPTPSNPSGNRPDDLLIGMPNADVPAPLGTEVVRAGRVFVTRFSHPDLTGPTTLRFTLDGSQSGECFGTAIAAVNQSGTLEDLIDEFIVVGAPDAVDPTTNENSGAIRLFNATTGQCILERFPREDEAVSHEGSRFGFSIARLGDLVPEPGGGVAEEIAVGAPDAPYGGTLADAGKVYVYSVFPGPQLALQAILTIPLEFSKEYRARDARFGFSVAGPGNLDLGVFVHAPAELLVGAPLYDTFDVTDSGQGYIYEWDFAMSKICLRGEVLFFPGISNEKAGWSMSGAGNIDSAVPEQFVAIGAPGSGRVGLVPSNGGVPSTILSGSSNFGTSLAEADPPGTTEDGVLIGEPFFGSSPGRAHFAKSNGATISLLPIQYCDPDPPAQPEISVGIGFGSVVSVSNHPTLDPRFAVSAPERDFVDIGDSGTGSYRVTPATAPCSIPFTQRYVIDLGRVYTNRLPRDEPE